VDDSRLGVIQLGRPDSLIRAYEELHKGSMVAVLADRVESEARLQVDFLGKKTTMPTGAHVLAARSRAPALMFFGLYEGGNRYRIEFVEFGEIAEADARGEELRNVVERYTDILARYAKKHPFNWFNFYPYWEQTGS
jgi:predicted LPLAT superfamily acyltransferase